MSKIINSLRILATTDSGMLSWQRSARLAVAKAADEIEQLRARVAELEGGVMPWMTGECSRTVPDEWVRAAAVAEVRKP